MNKIIQYLNNNLSGEVLSNPMIRLSFSRDKSPLRIIPDAIIYPRKTADIRKVAKLANQLATKGKTIPLTVRGNGNDTTGGAIGDGYIINTSKHMNRVIDIDTDQALIHVQAGTSLPTIESLTKTYGLRLPFDTRLDLTIGGLIGSNNAEVDKIKITKLYEAVDQLEVVLAGGDVIQTKRLSKHELSKKIGLSNSEGELYRKIDRLIETNSQLIHTIDTTKTDNAGYAGIAEVKAANGSFDLTPLLLGSQGTLGIISEAIIKLDILLPYEKLVAMAFVELDDALNAAQEIAKFNPEFIDIYSSDIFIDAMNYGKKFDFFDQAIETFGQQPVACLLVCISNKSIRGVDKTVKKVTEIIKKNKGYGVVSSSETIENFESIRDLPASFIDGKNGSQNIPLISGMHIPTFRLKEFSDKVAGLEQSLDLKLPFFGSLINQTINVGTMLNLKQVSDRQKVFRLLGAFSALAHDMTGVFCTYGAEGRLKAPFANKTATPEIVKLYSEIRKIFDPAGILNPDVKNQTELKNIFKNTVDDYYNGILY